ncbi:MAG: DNA alkylation repair protein [Candidatus Zixiibacteriota bacterium]
MDYNDVMSELEKMGTAQNVKIYKRHGAGDNLFGVSFGNLNKLKKKTKFDHDLALKLWESGNADARTFAILIADPNQIKASTADAWVKDINYYLLSDLLAGLVAKSPIADKMAEKWMKAKKEFIRQCGYNIIGAMFREGRDFPDATCKQILTTIEKEIHASPNRARHAMNMALIAIGIYKRNLTDDAIAAAERIGVVEVDHGETSCKTPAAIPYIKKALARPAKKGEKKSAA